MVGSTKRDVIIVGAGAAGLTAALHLAKIGVELDTLTSDQAQYIGVEVKGPFKPEYYRY